MFDVLCPIAPLALHNLRRTFATGLAELSVAPHVIERLLNHAGGTISGVAAIYNRFKHQDEMREAIKLWEARLHGLITLRRAA
jgi:integrase